MYDSVLSKDIYQVLSYKGPVLMTEKDGEETVLRECPFCGAPVRTVPKDKEYRYGR